MSGLSKLIREQHQSNVIYSQFSSWLVMSMLRYSIVHTDDEELKNLIANIGKDIGIDEQHNTLRKIRKHYLHQSITTNNSNNDEFSFIIANRLYIAPGYKLDPEVQIRLCKSFESEVQHIDFHHNDAAANCINEWIATNTNRRISHIISSDMVSDATCIVLVSAIYFKAQWLYKFNEADTSSLPFHVSATEMVEVPMMSATMQVPYAYIPELAIEAIELPYLNTDLTMLIILPKTGDLSHLLELLEKDSSCNIRMIYKNMKLTEVDVNIPRFSYETTIDLRDLLQKLGVNRIFQNADSTSGLSVSNILQKAYINVTEEGTEAAAISTLCVDGAAHYDVKFMANRPFYFCLKNSHFVKFFEGCYKSPKE